MNAVARRVVSLVAPMLGGRFACRLSVAPAPALARVDSVQLDNAVLNPCLNARDAMPEGGTLLVSTCVRRLEAGESGLGLHMVQGFVRPSGGDVRVWSRPGEGTRCALMLPGAAAPAEG